jgi:hypothetical protein
MSDSKTTGEPTEDDALALLKELGLTYHDGAIGTAEAGFFVIIFCNRKKPPLTKFRGWPIRYSIGGGMPRAHGGA